MNIQMIMAVTWIVQLQSIAVGLDAMHFPALKTKCWQYNMELMAK